MRRPKPQRTDRAPAAATEPTLNQEYVERWAELIADGRDSFPAGLSPPDRDCLLAAVWRRRRDRLVLHIARAITCDLRGAMTSY
jgi:hypothetical protein